jgi:hypothetical protein
MRPEIEGLVTSTEYDQRHVLYEQYDADAGNWTKLSFTAASGVAAGGGGVPERGCAAQVGADQGAQTRRPRRVLHGGVRGGGRDTHEQIFDQWCNTVRPQTADYSENKPLSRFLQNQT